MHSEKEHITNAFKAMKRLGISVETVKPVLKRLVKLYNNNWQLIEEDSYRTLVDAIFEYEDDKLVSQLCCTAKQKAKMINDDEEPPLKKQQRGNGEEKSLSSKDKGKAIACLEEGEKLSNGDSNHPKSLENGEKNAIMPRERQPNDQSPQIANSSHVSRGSTNPSRHSDTTKKLFHKLADITKGTEKVKISLVDEIGNEDLPKFVYCPDNIAYESAYVHISLARIADEDCCSGCVGDCVSSPIPCECASSSGGEFAYTTEGLLTEKFLEACISPNQHAVYCQDCPSERAKNPNLRGNCKGHPLKKFIKECWRKCGCSMECRNRVVQRGIVRKLQVFLTRKGKGWGLRTIEELPQGAFICEYVGEILTNIELYERNTKRSNKDKHVYPVLLDADWSTEENLKDEEALCLDATHYGNIARFINHRCEEANLIEIPVQVETPDRHYYHVAFFTKRKVEALEELTWDYRIDFDDDGHPIEAFRCRCGSDFCRDKARR